MMKIYLNIKINLYIQLTKRKIILSKHLFVHPIKIKSIKKLKNRLKIIKNEIDILLYIFI